MDFQNCKYIGERGSFLIKDGCNVLTHCNAGYLSSAGCGTALAPIYAAKQRHEFNVYCCETSPKQQGIKTAWELQESGFHPVVVPDGLIAQTIRDNIHLVIVGAVSIAANGDVASSAGTYGLAVLANYHKIPFYVAAPAIIIDSDYKEGCMIPKTENLFDITPAGLVTGIICERGVCSPVTSQNIKIWSMK